MRCRLILLLPVAISLPGAQPAWKEFSLGPMTPKGPPNSDGKVRNGGLRAKSISTRSLIAIAAGVSPTHVLGPDWIDTERFSVAAVLADDSRSRLRTRPSGGAGLDDEFRELFSQEIASRFHLEIRRERRDVRGFVVRPPNGAQLKARQSKSLEGGRFIRKGTPIVNVFSTLDARGTTLQDLCNWLERQLNAPVVSNDGLPIGVWDFRLRWRSGDQTSLRQAVREQVGLDIVEGNTLVEYIVVSPIEKPDFGPH